MYICTSFTKKGRVCCIVQDNFNTAARVGLKPHYLPQITHFYLTGQCNKGDSCAFQHVSAQALAAHVPIKHCTEHDIHMALVLWPKVMLATSLLPVALVAQLKDRVRLM